MTNTPEGPKPAEILPSAASFAADAPDAARAAASAAGVVRRLARTQALPDSVLAALQGPLGEAIASAGDYATGSLSDATRRAYTRDWWHFADWCRAQGVEPALPVHPVLVAAYLASLADTLGRSALNGRLAAIAHAHRQQGHPWTPGHNAIRETLRGVGRKHGKPVRPAAALTSVEIKQLLATCADGAPGAVGASGAAGLAGARDRALLLVGFAGAFRRSELVAIDFVHLRFDAAGVTIHVPRSKRDQEGKGADVTLPRMHGSETSEVHGTSGVRCTCPVRALERWLSRGKIRRGAVFRSITAHGKLGDRLSPDGVRHILLHRAAQAKLTVHPSERLSPHGLRAGFITEAYLAAAPDEQVMAHTRHTDLSTMRGYRRRARITADNPARLLDL